MPQIQVNGVNLFYEWHGNPAGPLIVFVNGLLTDTSSWHGHLPHFTDTYRCLVYDCRGQGQSDKPDQVYDTALHTADLAAFTAALGIERAYFVGMSNGGAVCLGFATQYPARVAGLALTGAYAWVDTILRVKLTSWVRAMEAGGGPLRFDVAVPWIWGGAFLDAQYEVLLTFREKGLSIPIHAAANLIRGAMTHDVRAQLPRVAAPVLVIVGEEDVLTPPKLARQIAAGVPQGELMVMPGGGHAAALEDVAGFCALVREFFDGFSHEAGKGDLL